MKYKIWDLVRATTSRWKNENIIVEGKVEWTKNAYGGHDYYVCWTRYCEESLESIETATDEEALKESEILLVPDEVEFRAMLWTFGVRFSETQILWRPGGSSREVINLKGREDNKIKCQFIPCKLEDLQAGDWCFEYRPHCPRSDEVIDLENYHLNIGDNNYVYVNEWVQTCNLKDWDYYKYYKVVPL